MVSILASNVVDHRFQPWSGQTKDYEIGICCFFLSIALRSESKDLLAWNQDNLSEWIVVSVSYQSKNSTQQDLVQSRNHHHFIENNLFLPSYSCKIAYLVGINNNHWPKHTNVLISNYLEIVVQLGYIKRIHVSYFIISLSIGCVNAAVMYWLACSPRVR